jgi:hypothetical protein
MKKLCFVWLLVLDFLAFAAVSQLFECHHRLIPYILCIVIGLTTGLAVHYISEE